MRIIRTIPLFLLMMFSISAGYLFVSEFQWQNSPAADFGQQQTKSPLAIPFSRVAREDALLICTELLTAPVSLFQPAPVNFENAKRCEVLAKGITQETPSLALGHFITGLSKSQISGGRAGLKHMQLSQKYGRYEGWLAEHRFYFLAGINGPDTEAAISTEIKTLLVTQSGAELVARHFVQVPGLRDQIKAAARLAVPVNQRRLLNILSRMDRET